MSITDAPKAFEALIGQAVLSKQSMIGQAILQGKQPMFSNQWEHWNWQDTLSSSISLTVWLNINIYNFT